MVKAYFDGEYDFGIDHNIVKTLTGLNADESKELMTCANFKPAGHLRHLYDYLLENKKIEDLSKVNEKNLSIISDKVLTMIQNGEDG